MSIALETITAMPLGVRLRQAAALNRAADVLALAGLRRRLGAATAHELGVALAAQRIGTTITPQLRELLVKEPTVSDAPVDFLSVAARAATACDTLGIPYLIGGGVASTVHGEFRTTRDVDLIVRVPLAQAGAFAALLAQTFLAIKTLAENGCTILWTGEGGVRLYAHGLGETRSASRLLHQARLCANPTLRLKVVRQMYEQRFPGPLDADLTLQQIRGKEGVRVREAYAKASKETGVAWVGREYKRDDWKATDPVNRALSAANSCLYGVCHAAILSAGYAPGLGFVHTGKLLLFVYDIADLYKAEITIPAAFKAVKDGEENMEGRVRRGLRDRFKEARLLARIVDDIDNVLNVGKLPDDSYFDSDAAAPSQLWDPELGGVAGGTNHGDEVEET